jgi:sterol desaturase/sphingolipid hydroxylase (fatty acid hydroxylase superfamily)
METLKSYFETMPEIHRLLILVFSFSLFWYIERIKFLKDNYKKLKHLSVNGLFSFTAIPVQIILGLVIIKVTDFNLFENSGLVHIDYLQHSIILQLIVSFVVLDLLEYIYHVIMHHVKRLWMIHLVHHSDQTLDVSSTLREHPLETFVRLSFLVLFLYLTGTEYWMLMLRQAIQIVANVFSHSNYHLPNRVNKIVSLLFVTPNFHHVHHHNEMPYTNTNYGDIFTIWDRMFGTYATLDSDKINYGVDSFPEVNEDTKFKKLLRIPFTKYRPIPNKNDKN